MKALDLQPESHGIIVKTGALVETNGIDTPPGLKDPSRYEVLDRDDPEETLPERAKEVKKELSARADTQGAWIKKSGKPNYSYKKHRTADEEGSGSENTYHSRNRQ